jgi:archaemetzincin
LTSLSENKIIISPVGDLDSINIEQVRKSISELFGFETEIISLLKDLKFALDSGRKQYHSTKILQKLEDKAPSNVVKVLAICDVDLFIPILTHVYGEAQLGGITSIVSVFRLSDNLPILRPRRTFQERLNKEAIHELGHTFNLRHCSDQYCGMHYCRSINDVDHKSVEFCRYCRILLNDELKRISPQKHSSK